ncbi:Protein O-glucosyltransferase 2 [Geodia barretti]|uniref:Protein O-glucosyltransferase 2 n=1 Tax=Geodia barretti TaxID=519541 RepID=A0AA35S072_GEOBA|nr:Protein O-glucosyltransferase 2 [Geodia barretti]
MRMRVLAARFVMVKKWSFCASFGPPLVALGALFVSLRGCGAAPALSLTRTRIYGPGIHPKRCSLPINYFYIQAVDTDGNNYRDVTEATFEVSYETDDAGSNNRVRRRQEVLNLRDGLILHQFRIYHDYHSLAISVTHRGKHVAGSPYHVSPVLHEDCACPLRSLDEWTRDFDCPDTDPQILEDLEPFREDGINVTNLYDRGGELFPRHSFIHYSIVDGKVYAQSFGSITGFKFMSDMFLLSMANKMRLPDMELVVNLGDWPLDKAARMPLFPVFSWCGSPDTRDIIWPTWDIMKSTVMGLERVSLTTLSVQKTRGEAWETREPRAFFRGRDSNRERLDLVRLHRNETELFDVALTNWFFFTKEYSEEVYGPKAKHVSFHDFFKARAMPAMPTIIPHDNLLPELSTATDSQTPQPLLRADSRDNRLSIQGWSPSSLIHLRLLHNLPELRSTRRHAQGDRDEL